MDKLTFNNAILSETKLNELSILDLQRLVEQFPYFQTARILLLKRLKDEDLIAFDKELKKSAVAIGDRAKLYIYINAFGSTNEILPKLSLVTFNGNNENTTINHSGNSNTTFKYLFLPENDDTDAENNQNSEVETANIGSDNGWDLIDQFVSIGNTKLKPKDQSQIPQGNLAENSAIENNSILTETLAKIYIKQKKYDQAISIFQGLSLKFPNKSTYFAARIEELEIILKNS